MSSAAAVCVVGMWEMLRSGQKDVEGRRKFDSRTHIGSGVNGVPRNVAGTRVNTAQTGGHK
ncbi:hypothetical protein LTR86_010013 [Recurvomyces mirabilis]|nr:hypothetical protein LTR86_010013 [Recurvomyces mirabilis]